jgi:hypothetical protein
MAFIMLNLWTRKLSARSTGERDKVLLKIAIWKANGLPTGRMRRPRPLEVAAGLDAILKSIRKTVQLSVALGGLKSSVVFGKTANGRYILRYK